MSYKRGAYYTGLDLDHHAHLLLHTGTISSIALPRLTASLFRPCVAKFQYASSRVYCHHLGPRQ